VALQHVGFVVEKVVVGEGLLQVLRFPLPIIPPSQSIGAGTIGLIGGRSAAWTQTIPIKKNHTRRMMSGQLHSRRLSRWGKGPSTHLIGG
jgi:hypothetical protein